MSPLPSLAQLKLAVQICEQIEKLQEELAQLLGSTRSALVMPGAAAAAAALAAASPSKAPVLKRARRVSGSGATPANGSRVSAQGSQRIAAAQRRRWARFRRARKEAAEQNGSGHAHDSANGLRQALEDAGVEI